MEKSKGKGNWRVKNGERENERGELMLERSTDKEDRRATMFNIEEKNLN